MIPTQASADTSKGYADGTAQSATSETWWTTDARRRGKAEAGGDSKDREVIGAGVA
jgi:hypothetical protein